MTVKVIKNKITKKVGQLEERFKTLPQKAYAFWRKTTPIKTGNARRKTKLDKDVIRARYPYAERLNDGWSKQAPRGMYLPTVEYIKKITNKFVRKK